VLQGFWGAMFARISVSFLLVCLSYFFCWFIVVVSSHYLEEKMIQIQNASFHFMTLFQLILIFMHHQTYSSFTIITTTITITITITLGTNGFMTYIANRGDDLEMRFLKPMFELGRSRFTFYSPRDRDSIAETIADADLVINMTGKYYETKHLIEQKAFPYLNYTTNYSYQEANVDIPQTIAELCTEMQVDNLIHVSSINASPDSNSTWAKTKYEGEMAVKEAYPWATIVRPTQMFGHEDRLLNWFANSANVLPAIPMFDGGHALTQPVYAVNVADAIQKIVDAPEKFEGRTVDCFGPQDYSYKELAAFVYDITGQEPSILDVPRETGGTIAKGLNLMGTPILTPDMVEMWSEDFIPSMTQEEYDAQPTKEKIFTLKDLGIDSVPMEKIAFNYLHRYREGGHFSLEKGYH
jgi:NADH dehydrogenase (ubiquinone) 1 alpha subcomplex subunit 9